MTLDFQTVSPEQKDSLIWTSKTGFSELFYYGGLGCGKTYAGGLRLLRYLAVPNTPVLVVRRTLKTLKATTLRSWMRKDKPILPPEMISKYDRQSGHISLVNGSYIDCIGSSNIDDILTSEYAMVFIDELPQIPREVYDTLLGRLRYPHPLGQCLMSCFNPCSVYSWVYEHLMNMQGEKAFKAIRGRTGDNKNLPASYEATLRKSYSERQIKMLLEGEFVPDEDQIFYAFSQANVVEGYKGKIQDAAILQDFGGGTGDCALLLVYFTRDGGMYIDREHIKPKMTHSDVDVVMNEMWESTPYSGRTIQVVYDSANAALANEMRRRGYDVFKADKNIEHGIATCNDELAKGNILINQKCSGLINSLQMLTRESLTKKKSTRGWDAVDALRYGVMWYSRDNTVVM